MTTPSRQPGPDEQPVTLAELEELDRNLAGLERLLGIRCELNPHDEQAARVLAAVALDRGALAQVLAGEEAQ